MQFGDNLLVSRVNARLAALTTYRGNEPALKGEGGRQAIGGDVSLRKTTGEMSQKGRGA